MKKTICTLLCVLLLFTALCWPFAAWAQEEEPAVIADIAPEEAPETGDGTPGFIAAAVFFFTVAAFAVGRMRQKI